MKKLDFKDNNKIIWNIFKFIEILMENIQHYD